MKRLLDKTCEQCQREFQSRRESTRFCSKSCVWKATRGPEFNARIARETAAERSARQRGTGTKGYVKRGGRHEHRVVAEEMLGRPLRKGEIVHHKDGNKHNNDPSNLEVMTQSEHMREHGLGVQGVAPKWVQQLREGGAAIGKAKISKGDVYAIRRMHADGIHRNRIAKHFDISPRHVNAIVSGEIWRGV